MQDNGLLKYYKDCSAKDGFLDLDKLPFKNQSWENKKFNEIEGIGSFYIKSCIMQSLEPEILVSQIYAQLGLTTAIYLPAISSREQNKQYVVSNNIGGEDITNMYGFFREIKKQIPHILDKNAKDDISPFFTTEALRALAMQEVASIACNNTDAHSGNRLVKVTKTQPFTKGVVEVTPVMADEIRNIDYGFCFLENKGIPLRTEWYTLFNEDGISQKFSIEPSARVIELLKINPVVQQNITSDEMAEMIGNCDIYETAKDVAETTGYSFNSNFLNKFANSVDLTAEMLAK